MEQIILLIRTSTERQEIEAQKNDLIHLAELDGYAKSQMVIIEGQGASAIKLNETYLAEMEELYNTIETQDIVAVYAWEISRIGRNEELLMKFKNFLIDKGVQLVIMHPSLRLLNPDKSVNNGVELAFSLFATMSKQEMQIKKDRFARAKARNKAEGKYNGGRIKLGYALNRDKYFVENEETSKIVRDVFQWYLDGVSKFEICKRLVDLGVVNFKKQTLLSGGTAMCNYILKDTSYIGEGSYPQIVDKDTFDKVQEKLSQPTTFYRSKHVYYCKGLLMDCSSGYYLCGHNSDYQLKLARGVVSVSANALDYIALYSANILLAEAAMNEAQTNRNEFDLKIEENEEVIKTKQKQIKEYTAAIDRAITMNIQQPKYFPTEKMDAIIKKNDKAIERLKAEIVDLTTDIERMRKWLDGEQTFINRIEKNYSDEKKKELINTVIRRIELDGEKGSYTITVKNKIGYANDLVFIYKSATRRVSVEQLFKDGTTFDLTPALKNHVRFKRIRYEKKKPS